MDGSSQWRTGMLRPIDDRSSTLSSYARSVGARAVRSSHISPAKRNLIGLSHLKQGFTTPHDQILEKIYHVQDRSESVLPLATELGSTSLSLPLTDHKSRSLNEPANFPASATPTASFASNPSLATRLYDPFDGSPLGVIVPVESLEREGEDMPANATGNSHDELWSHLSRVLDLQHQIARMHVDMEGVGLGKQPDCKGKGSLGTSSRATGFPRPRTASASSVPGIEDDVGAVDEEAEKLRAREREFKKLATQFQGRKQAIDAMMEKVGSSTLSSRPRLTVCSLMTSPRHSQNSTHFKLPRWIFQTLLEIALSITRAPMTRTMCLL